MARRILYLQPSFMPPPVDPERDRFYHLGQKLEGDVLQALWFRTQEEVEAVFGPGSYPVYQCGGFRYHWFLAYRYQGVALKLRSMQFFLSKALELHAEKPFDCIVVYSHMTTSLMGALLKLWTGTKLIIEIVTAPHLVYLSERARPGWKDRLRKLYSDILLHINVQASDCTHLLYPWQLDRYSWLAKAPVASFHEFVPVSRIARHLPSAQPYLMLVGSPWYLKGADLMVKAFFRIRDEFPALKLKIQGHFPDRAELDAIVGNCPDIEILAPAPNPETVQRMGQARAVVLPSRCDGLPRVLTEALATGVACIGSDAGGIPFLVRDGENGFVFPLGDLEGLVECLRQLLRDDAMRLKMGERGYEIAHQELTEQLYVDRFAAMIEETATGSRRPLPK